jgi:hypothetical protein
MKKHLLLFGLLITSVTTWAQTSKFTGAWSLVSVENTNADNSKTFPYGEEPKGLLVLEQNGDYAVQILKAARPKVVSNNKNTATPEENAALVQGNNSHFGKFLIDENNHTITYQVEHAFFPNWEGRELKSSYTLTGDILKIFSNNTTNGGASAIVTWKRK